MAESEVINQHPIQVDIMNENQVINQEEEESVEVAFELGEGFISQSELDRLLSSEDPKDKGRLKSTVIVAATNGNSNTANYLFSQGYQIELLNEKNQTITHLAYYSDAHVIISQSGGQAFSNCENYTNYTDCNGLSHLHIACATGYVDIVKQFLNNGEDINGSLTSDCNKDRRGFTPLHFAVAHHEMEVIQLLLERGADIKAVDSLGFTPFLLACPVSRIFKTSTNTESLRETTHWKSELDILELLLKYKSDLSVRDNYGNTSVLNIYNNYYYNRLDNDNIDDSDLLLNSNLAKLLHKRQLEKFMILYRWGANISVLNNNDENILHCIIRVLESTRFSFISKIIFQYDDMYATFIQLLIRSNNKLDVNAKNKQGESPLALAVSLISCKIVKILLDHNADLNSIDIDGHKFFKYPNVMLTVEVVFNLKSIILLLVDKGFNLTLEANIAIMKFLTHDVDDCICGNVNRTDLLPYSVFCLISHSFPCHLKRIFTNLYENSNEELRNCLLTSFQVFLEYSKLIPYSISLDNEILQLVYTNDLGDIQSITNKCSEEIVVMKSTKLKCGMSMYDLLTKYSRKANIFNSFDADDIAVIMQLEVISGLIVWGHIKKLMVRTYVESSALKSYISLILPYLPDLCRKMILEYLDTEDILRLCSAALLE